MASAYLVNDAAPITTYNLKTTTNPSQARAAPATATPADRSSSPGRHARAVTSFGDNAVCKGLDFSYRLDRPEVLAWIADPDRVDAG